MSFLVRRKAMPVALNQWRNLVAHSRLFQVVVGLILLVLTGCSTEVEEKPAWPVITRETKPWTRWWWHGSAVTKEGITAEMAAYQKAGLGGLEITPIYGVYGYEEQFVEFLSPEWMELFLHTLKEAERLGLGIDMATGTGWPFGGPWVNANDASKDINYKTFVIKGGERLKEKIEFIQQPFLHAVGNQIYEVSDNFSATIKSTAQGNPKESLRIKPSEIDIKKLVEPISANKNLQKLALDQVKFEKSLPLKLLVAYGGNGETIDLTKNVVDGVLDWTAPNGSWKLYALFEGWHGKMVERAGPGGEGNVIDHFSSIALTNYLEKFDTAFAGKKINSLRSFFNDSYEVDDARGAATWTPFLLEEFAKRRDYKLEEHLPALFGQDEEEKNRRILCDYRETISELLLENFTAPWKEWAHKHGALVRNQAHGSPANILDLYATVDIPEIEGVESLRTKMASSAANVTGKKLVSSESATWLNEHFESSLSDIKSAVDQFLLNGVNHIFYHGTSYSPPGEPWPGWLFYAAVHLNPRNPIWKDFDALNLYVSRAQSLLQQSQPDNDVLVYYPIYDRFSTPGPELVEHFDSPEKQFEGTAFLRAIQALQKRGFSFDYISDRQLKHTKFEGGYFITEGLSKYKTVIVPQCEFIPLATMQHLVELSKQGASVILFEGFPRGVPGYFDHEKNRNTYHALTNRLVSRSLDNGVKQFQSGSGRFLLAKDMNTLMQTASVEPERLTSLGLDFIRKSREGNRTIYFISNKDSLKKELWVPLNAEGESVTIYDPMTGEIGTGKIRDESGYLEVFAQLAPQQSLFFEVSGYTPEAAPFPYRDNEGEAVPLSGKWKIQFDQGGPELPEKIETDSLVSWTSFGAPYRDFSGTATYEINFATPAGGGSRWVLSLGNVKESARVVLNGRELGTLLGPVYEVMLKADDLHDSNVLQIVVTNSMANRIASLDRSGVFWKKFYNINFPARKPENRKNGLFDASAWEPRESGLLGPVTLRSVNQK